MINKIKKQSENTSVSSNIFKSVVLTWAMIVFSLNQWFTKNNTLVKAEIKKVLDDHPGQSYTIQEVDMVTTKTDWFDTVKNSVDVDSDNALTFAVDNVDKYYPDMKDHLTTMMNSFRDEEHQSATIKLLDEMVANITDPAQKTGAIIYALEWKVFYKWTFAKKYDSQITDETFNYMETFRVKYQERFKMYYDKLLAETDRLKQEIANKQAYLKQKDEELKQKDEELKQKDEELKQKDEELKQILQELEATLSKFSPEDVKNNAWIKKLTLDTEQFYIDWWFPVSPHLKSLFDATK